jgi:hypothetical protein
MTTTQRFRDEVSEAKATLARCDGNRSETARVLGISRSTLRYRLTLPDEATAPKAGKAASKLPPPKPVDPDVEAELRAVRVELGNLRKDALNEEYIKRKIIKMNEESVEPPRWLLTPNRAKPKSPGVPTLFASDWHWGEVVDPTQVGGVNEYNVSIAQRRARTLIQSAVDLLQNHMVNPDYPGIVFALGGDMVSGNIHEELAATNQIDIMPTVLDVFGVLQWCISTLADKFGRVFVPCVSGNHGRDTHKIRSKGRNFTSFDWLIYCFLAKRFEGDKRVTFYIPNGSDALYKVFNHTYLLTHGDQFRGGDGMIGALGPIIRGDHRKRGRQTQIGAPYDTMILGHWHQDIRLRRLIVAASLKGFCEYSYTNNFGYEPPSQPLWITHPTRGVTFSMPVYVDPAQSLQPAPNWVSWQQ